jgi:N-acetylmuramoyl-L-alanine amidase
MSFIMKYEIKADYIAKGKRRPGTFITPKFGVLHDTGNPGSTAQNNRNYFNNTPNDPTAASAHTFIDDGVIIESIPATTGKPERAHHVRYQMTQDNTLFGDDANDIGIGVELCFGGNINFEEAYKRYVWYCAYVSYKFGFSPTQWIGHEKLDPGRKTDPTNALKRYGKTYAELLADIVNEFAECTKPIVSAAKLIASEDGVYWNGVKLAKGQIGRLYVLKPIVLWNPDRVTHRVLQPGEVIRVYGEGDRDNYKYEVGGGYTVSHVETHVRYEKADDDLIEANEAFYGGGE